ncbi:MAG: N-acetylmuramoyl-L-alanine amidase [Legionellaceae bacterium]|nr:N-acetylmuramoyl-L-alanine amidase [Legionellaceae bacterium]HCA89582.1 N-acetylmuramoyl-L-alanine amidase [Legionellales bacterium]|tara:strand:+ start:1760 stop:3070 length:1311 start_codon:yes stop_codon:yes gene_type:complete
MLRIAALLVMFMMHTSGYANALTDIALQENNQALVLKFKLKKPVKYHAFTLIKPYRIVLDLVDTDMQFNPKKLNMSKKSVCRLRVGHPKKHILRLVFDISNQTLFDKSLALSPQRIANNLVLKLPKHNFPANLAAQHTINLPPKHLRDVMVVLDPGHGGHDPGALGLQHTAEKNITLAIALKLKSMINKEPGIKAVLTRQNDSYLSLRARLTKARQYNADIFISIHADAFINRHSQGASVFALSQSGATSEAARWLAEKENYAELGGINLKGLDDQNGLVRTVLIDLSQTATIRASIHMGKMMLANLGHVTVLHNKKVEQARFMVLKSPDIPSVLIETGFISNPKEEKNLNNQRYQNKLAQSLLKGLRQYFWAYPPHNTYIEAHVKSHEIYVVRAQDTWPSIAKKYQLSVDMLKHANRLPADLLKIGQQLIIPRIV